LLVVYSYVRCLLFVSNFQCSVDGHNQRIGDAMDIQTLLQTATVLLGITAAGGLMMAILRFTGADRPPSWLAMLHGLLAGSGLTLLLYAGFTVGMPKTAWVGLALLVFAALGGVVLNLAYHVKHQPLPKGLVIVHTLLAVASFGLIWMNAFR
jgi:hypothetical protein